MSSVLRSISVEEYLRRERKADFKSEFLRGEMFAMAGGSAKHSLIAANWVREAGSQLKGRPCRVFNSDLRVKVMATGLYTYPDSSIVCGELEFDDEVGDTLTNPTVILEVLSESTEKYDRGRKSEHYRQIASLQELVLVSQNCPHVERFTRQPDGSWLFREEKNLENSFELESLEICLNMSEIYRGVQFEIAG